MRGLRFGVLALFAAIALPVLADAWPSRPIKLIVPFPPGSSPDLVARLLTEKLGAALGQPVIVENRPGAGGNLGTGLAAKAPPDGYTFCLSIPGPLAVNTMLYRKMEYDPFTELAPVTLVGYSPNVLVVDAKLGVGTVAELIARAKDQPGKLNYGSVGNGSASHLTMELLKFRAGVDIVHVPYPGSPQVTAAMLSDQIAAAFVVPATAMPLVRSGRLKMIATTSPVRTALLPGVPTVAESGFPGFESTAWNAVVAPAKTPPAIIARVASELATIIRNPEARERMAALYFEPVGSTPKELADFMRAEAARWGDVIRKTGAQAD